MRDFTLKAYQKLLDSFRNLDFSFVKYSSFNFDILKKQIILRHDIDDRKENALIFARLQNQMGIYGTYYFRVFPQSFDKKIISQIHSMGHEIGYHYETLDTCKGNVDNAYSEFCRNLDEFRKFVPVETICMHGSPRSPWDNRKIWEKYNFQNLGLVAEPYLSLDFNKVFYITDTGRKWNGSKFSIRDKPSIYAPVINKQFLKCNFRTTFDIIQSAENKAFPSNTMMTFHPQRWNDNMSLWLIELILQNVKNVIKQYLISQNVAEKIV